MSESIGDLGRQLWGDPNPKHSTRDELRFGAHGSKSIKVKERTWYDHETEEGGGYNDLYKRVHGELPADGLILAHYDYHDAAGKLLFQVVRKLPKKFAQRRPNGAGGWIWDMKGVERVPYRLPELLRAAAHAPVFICEGEKDCDALHERMLIATTNPGGAGKWLSAMSEHLRGRTVVILPDNDQAGADHAADVASKLRGIARSVKVVALPGLPEKGDVCDWLGAGGTAEELEHLARDSVEEKPEPTAKPSSILTVLTPADCELARPRPYIVKGLIGRGDVVLIIGAPGAGKSVLAPHIGYGAAQGREVFGRRVRKGPVLYLAAEDGAGMRLRVRALRQHWGDAQGFHLVPDAIDLKDADSPTLAAVRTLIEQIEPVIIIIDTLARAFPGLRENEPDTTEGMGRVVRIARELADLRQSAVIIAHHPPKDGSTARGHGALGADADVAMIVEGATRHPRTIRFDKNRNGPSDATLAFSVRVEHLGEDDDGDPVTAAIAEEAATSTRNPLQAKEAKLPDGPAVLLREWRNLLAEAGEPAQPELAMPMVTAVSRSALRQRLIDRSWFPESMLSIALNGTATLKSTGYTPENNALKMLKRRGFLGFNRDWVWQL